MRWQANWMLRLAALGLALQNRGGAAIAVPPPPSPDRAITLTGDGLLVAWAAPWPKFLSRADGALRVELAGYEEASRPGLPEVPFASVLLALPPVGDPVIQVRQETESTALVPGSLAIGPYPRATERDGSSGKVDGGAFAPGNPDPAATSFPPRSIQLDVLGVAGGIRLARLTFYPLHRAGAEWRMTTWLSAEVRFNAPAHARQTPLSRRVRSVPIRAAPATDPHDSAGVSSQPKREST